MNNLKAIGIAGLMAIATVLPSYAVISSNDIQQAAQIYCSTLKSGQSAEEAQKAANDYLTAKVNKDHTPDLADVRKQMRQAILNLCPDQVKK
ncbi:MAG: hypothetical protein VKJ02_01120 [Snowella sp.]|nr:hypothetical protein [Snowella sp.]